MGKYNKALRLKKLIFASLFLVFCVNFSFSQYEWTNAEVYLKDGEILTGEAKIPMMGAGMNLSKEVLKYRTIEKTEKAKYQPKDIDSVIFTIQYKIKEKGKKIKKIRKETYTPVYLNKKKSRLGFAEILIDGDLRLAGRKVIINSGGNSSNITIETNGTSIDNFDYMGNHNQMMLLKDGEKPEIFYRDTSTKYFKKRTIKYFKDCIALKAKINNDVFKKENLRDIVMYYNLSCN
jgi:hypothetical protein